MNRILIADDEECLLLAYKKLLNAPGLEIETTQSAQEAQTLIAKNNYSVIIVDLRLAGTSDMEGLDIISSARKNFPECKILVLTAYGDSRIKESVIKAGATYFLEKPISAEYIKSILFETGIFSSATEPKVGAKNQAVTDPEYR